MFLGSVRHSLDEKGRVILPSRFRDDLGPGGVVGRGRGGCLGLWTTEGFKEVADRVHELERQGGQALQAARAFFSGTEPVTIDRQGRFGIPPALREYAGLAQKREVVITGVWSRIEIWESERWAGEDDAGTQSLSQAVELAELGI